MLNKKQLINFIKKLDTAAEEIPIQYIYENIVRFRFLRR